MPKTFPTHIDTLLSNSNTVKRILWVSKSTYHHLWCSYVMPNRIPATESVSHCWNEILLFRSSSVSRTSYRRINELFTWTEKKIYSLLCSFICEARILRLCVMCVNRSAHCGANIEFHFFSFFNEIIKIRLIKMTASNRSHSYCIAILFCLQ